MAFLIGNNRSALLKKVLELLLAHIECLGIGTAIGGHLFEESLDDARAGGIPCLGICRQGRLGCGFLTNGRWLRGRCGLLGRFTAAPRCVTAGRRRRGLRRSAIYILYSFFFFYVLFFRCQLSGRWADRCLFCFGCAEAGQVPQQVVQNGGGEPVRGRAVPRIEFDIRQILFLDRAESGILPGRTAVRVHADTLQNGIHLTVGHAGADVTLRLLAAQFPEDLIHRIFCTFGWHFTFSPYDSGRFVYRRHSMI